VLEQESRNRRALECGEAIYFRREEWANLYATYEKLVDVADGDDELADTYARMARLSSEALDQDERAVDLWGRVLDIRGEDTTALAALADLHQRRGKWEELVEVHRAPGRRWRRPTPTRSRCTSAWVGCGPSSSAATPARSTRGCAPIGSIRTTSRP
jgi:tetratricopeptide (TPR) repeat protein